MSEVVKLVEKMNEEWTQFKSENDRRLKEIEAKGRADPLTEEKIAKASAAIGDIQKQLEAMAAKMNRPGVGAGAGGNESEDVAAHRKAFRQFIAKGAVGNLLELQQKVLSIGVDADGGFAVPEQLDTTIGKMEINATPMLGEVSSMALAAESYEKLYDLRGTTTGWVGETDARPETNTPTLASFKPLYGEIYAFPFATQRMLDDAMFDPEAWLAAGVSEAFGIAADLAIISGDGVKKPKGILAYPLAATGDAARAFGTIEKLHTGTAGTFSSDNLLDLIRKLKPGYRQSAKWLMAGTTVDVVRKLKDTTGQYVWAPGLTAGEQSTLFGKPIVEDENMPLVGAAASAIILGDLKRAYKFVNLRGIRVLRDPYAVKGKVGFYTTQRVGGGVEDTSALKVLSLQV